MARTNRILWSWSLYVSEAGLTRDRLELLDLARALHAETGSLHQAHPERLGTVDRLFVTR